jgi:uncharacterized protein (UPF0276 family)
MMLNLPHIGHGVGLRTPHYSKVVADRPAVDWFEVISENFMGEGGNPRRVLRQVREHYPVVLHGVSLSLGSVDPLNQRYVDDLKRLAAEIEPTWISDHLSWGSLGGHYLHDLLPLPYTEEALAHVAERVARVQERLGRQILVENVSSYLSFAHSTMSEWEFLAALVERADCGLLLDVNNVFVSAHNHGLSAHEFLNGLPVGRVGQIHLAGHTKGEKLFIDTHDHAICDDVWALYRHALTRFGTVPTLIERDDHIPPLEELVAESHRAKAIAEETWVEARVRVG